MATFDDSGLPPTGPCQPWFDWEDVIATCPTVSGLAGLDQAVKDRIIAQASEIAYLLSERRYPGVCDITRSLCQSCSCGQECCSCVQRERISLSDTFPVASVDEVIIEGVPLARAGHWRIDNWRWLVRYDGDPWPRAIDLNEDDDFVVSWRQGRVPPIGGQIAAASFAAELGKACIPNQACQLPQRVTTIQREGVTYTVIDSMKMLQDEQTGFYPLDLWLMADKKGRQGRPRMIDPARCITKIAQGTDQNAS